MCIVKCKYYKVNTLSDQGTFTPVGAQGGFLGTQA